MFIKNMMLQTAQKLGNQGIENLKSYIINENCKTITLYNQNYIDNVERILYQSKIPNIKKSSIWNDIINRKTLKTGKSYIKLNNFTYIIINNNIMIDKGSVDFTPRELVISFVGKDKDKYFESFSRKLKGENLTKLKLIIDNADTFVNRISFNDIISRNKDTVKDYISKWNKSESLYRKYNIYFKTGILLYGPPGTGKTSMAKAIADELDINQIFNISLANSASNNINAITYRLNSIKDGKGLVVLLDDIDILMNESKENIDSYTRGQRQANLAFVLRLLDGAYTPEGTIFIATTNNIDALDKAMIRDGRFNLILNMPDFNEQEAMDMCKKYHIDGKTFLKDVEYPINPAKLENALIKQKLNKLF